MADEADRLAGIVSYERDRERLRSQAAAWRQMAGALASQVVAVVEAAPATTRDASRAFGMTGWLKRRRA